MRKREVRKSQITLLNLMWNEIGEGSNPNPLFPFRFRESFFRMRKLFFLLSVRKKGQVYSEINIR